MDSITKQKIPIIIREHILRIKIGYLIDILNVEKRKCEPIELDKPNPDFSKLYIKRTTKYPDEEENITYTTIPDDGE
jgi:1-acyl-sn-glycerol-3-phosphate acyltransferase